MKIFNIVVFSLIVQLAGISYVNANPQGSAPAPTPTPIESLGNFVASNVGLSVGIGAAVVAVASELVSTDGPKNGVSVSGGDESEFASDPEERQADEDLAEEVEQGRGDDIVADDGAAPDADSDNGPIVAIVTPVQTGTSTNTATSTSTSTATGT